MVKKRSRPQNTIQTQISDRKARRKEERKSKKKKQRLESSDGKQGFSEWADFHQQETQEEKNISKKPVSEKKKSKKASKSSKSEQKKSKSKGDVYSMLDEETAAALRKDDEEIAMLERNLGIHKSAKDKKKLNKEYSKLEGYGDDFGDFLDGLDTMLDKIAGDDDDYDENIDELDYDSDESDLAAARAKYLLRQEMMNDGDEQNGSDDESDSSEDEGEEMVPMKGMSSDDESENDDSDSENDNDIDKEGDASSAESEEENDAEVEDDSDDASDDSDSDNDSNSDQAVEKDHDEKDTYRPVTGQDLYGNTVEKNTDEVKPSKYVPPHLRKQQAATSAAEKKVLSLDDDPERKERLRMIQRLLNNNLNRLSDNTLESVAKAISSMYSSPEYSSRDINEKFLQNMKLSCVPPHMLMTSLIPIYLACVAGVHFQSGDSAQIGGYVVEKVVLELWDRLEKKRQTSQSFDDGDDAINGEKETANLMLLVCYLYNYNVAHCTLMYDIVRKLITSFTEIDVELLLLILSHCGSQLRSDDPTALKDIVLLVQERSMEIIKQNNSGKNEDHSVVTSSRAQFMITAITDLKNNKRRKTDVAIAEKTSHYRRVIGRMKSASTRAGSEPSSLRITVQDILDIEKKGRWWIVGATWVGNQHGQKPDGNDQEKNENPSSEEKMSKPDKKQQKLLKLAKKQRMNTDLRRSIFCIIMGSDDAQDAFEKLVRGGLLKGKSEREVVRVLIHCCAQEKAYNPYYAFLADRICDYQRNSRLSFQYALWDSFKQFDEMKARKAANLAKLLAKLVMEMKMNLNVLKPIDISPESMSESSIIFLTIFFSNIFEAFDDPLPVVEIIQRGDPTREQLRKQAEEQMGDDNAFSGNARQVLKDNISIFLMHYLENSPKNVKKSPFRKNLKAAIKACEENDMDMLM